MRRFIIILLPVISLANAYGQLNTGTLNFQLNFPQGDYKKTYPVTSTGLIFTMLHQLLKNPLVSIGGEFGILQVSGDNQIYTGVYNNEFNSFTVASWNHIFTMGVKLKIKLLPHSSWNLYTSFSLGTNLFFTFSSISRDRYWNPLLDIEIVEYYFSQKHSSWSLRTGAGLGAEFPFGKRKKVAWVLEASYLYGSKVKYFAHPSIENTSIKLDPRYSATSMLLFQTGIRFGIFNK